MSNYILADGVTAAQTLPAPDLTQPPGSNLPQGSRGVSFGGSGGGSTSPGATNQTFVLRVTGTGNVSGACQPIVSDDGIIWSNYGSVITATSAAQVAFATGSGSQIWNWFSALITMISGTNAKAQVQMNA